MRRAWTPIETGCTRRAFLRAACSGLALAAAGPIVSNAAAADIGQARFATRGVVLVPEDLSLADWPERAARAGLTTIGLHHPTSPRAAAAFVRSEPGQMFLDKCRSLGLHVEYELHAMRELLPRELHAANPEVFRMNDRGERVPDANCCVSSPGALEIIAGNALRLAEILQPTTGRYFYWGDDGAPWCRCPKCGGYSDSEQAVLLENAVLKALRGRDSKAQLAHLAYHNTLPPPKQVKPDPGVFLEFAPINRRYDIPFAQQSGADTDFGLESLDANLELFPADTAQVLEYWLDVSRFSGWKRGSLTKIPWDDNVLRADLADYARRGIRHITTFAAWIDAEYVRRFGEPPLAGYGAGLMQGTAQP